MELKATSECCALNQSDFGAFLGGDPNDVPVLTVAYQERLGLEPYFTYEGRQLTDRLDLHINVANGNAVLHSRDLAINGTGLPLTIDRTWNGLHWPIAGGRSDVFNWWLSSGAGIRVNLDADGGVSFYNPSGGALKFSHNSDGSFSSPPGIDATLAYVSSSGRYTLTSHKTGEVLKFSPAGNPVRVLSYEIDKNGNQLAYNDRGDGYTASITDTQGRTAPFSYSSPVSGNLISAISDWTGRQVQYSYDSSLGLTSSTDANGKTTSYGYDPASGLLTSVTDPEARVTQLQYDASNRVTSVTYGYGSSVAATWTYAYNSGNTVSTDPNNHSTTYFYDAQGRVTKVVDAQSNAFQTAWNADNHVASSTDAKNQTTTYGYDGTNENLTSVTLPTGASTSWGSYSLINGAYYPASSTDAQGNTSSYTYDASGNLATIADALPAGQNLTQLFYNANGTVDHAIDPLNNTTSYGYDAAGNLTGITPPSPLGAVAISPDSLSRVHSRTDGKSQTTTYTYDGLDRATNLAFADGSSVGYGYDGDGNQTSLADSVSGTTTASYDARNRQTSSTGPAGSVSYGYDPAGNLTALTDSGGTTGYGYNSLDELSSLTDPNNAQTTFGYDVNHHRTSTTYPNGVTTSQTYDASQRLASLTTANASTTLAGYSYSYTNPGSGHDALLPYSVTENDAPGVGPYPTRQFTTSRAYDGLNRLTDWHVAPTAGGTAIHHYQYQYDGDSNRTQIVADADAVAPNPVPKTVLAYNAASELSSTQTSFGCPIGPKCRRPARSQRCGCTSSTVTFQHGFASCCSRQEGQPGPDRRSSRRDSSARCEARVR